MLLTPAQVKIAEDSHRFRVVCCGRRFGKTTEAVEEIKGKALSGEANIAYIAPTFQQARDIAWEMLKSELKPIITRINESRLELEVRNMQNSTSKISLRGWEAVETLRGQKFNFIIIDEVASMRNFLSNWNEVVSPTLTDTKGECLFISTPKGFNHFYDLYNRESSDPDFKSFHFTSYDNPYLPIEEIDRQKFSIPEDSFAQEYLADFRKTEGLVYKEFDREKHLFDDSQLIRNVVDNFAGIDFGFKNPCAIIHLMRDEEENYWVYNEFYEREKTDEQIAEYVMHQNFNRVYPDPEAQGAIKALRDKRINVRDVFKGKDSIKTGITMIRELLISNRLKIHKRCVNLIYELETYSYPDKKDMRNENENPIKENDHALDALRYAISMHEMNKKHNTTRHFYPKR